MTDVAATLLALAEAVARSCAGSSIPVCVYWGARDEDCARMRIIEAARVPCYRSTRETIRALGALAAAATGVAAPTESTPYAGTSSAA